MITTKRIRGWKLQQIRARHLSAAPLCVLCEAEGRVSVATELDHILALCNGGTDVPDNYQSLCHDHHVQKTAADRGHTVKPPKRRVGADGYPIE